jgi:hypothetical protein
VAPGVRGARRLRARGGERLLFDVTMSRLRSTYSITVDMIPRFGRCWEPLQAHQPQMRVHGTRQGCCCCWLPARTETLGVPELYKSAPGFLSHTVTLIPSCLRETTTVSHIFAMECGDDMDVSHDGSASKRAVCESAPLASLQILTAHRSATLVGPESQFIVPLTCMVPIDVSSDKNTMRSPCAVLQLQRKQTR